MFSINGALGLTTYSYSQTHTEKVKGSTNPTADLKPLPEVEFSNR